MPWLKVGPLKVELMNLDPYLAIIRELLFEHECDNITEFLSPLLGQPPGRMSLGRKHKNDWTMKK